MTKLVSVLSAAVMLAVCALPASALTQEEEFERQRLEVLQDTPAPVEIDPADPNYPILSYLEYLKSQGCLDNHKARYSANDEDGNVIEHYKYVPDEGISIRSTYTKTSAKKGTRTADVLWWCKPGQVICNPYKACIYLERTGKDLTGISLGVKGAVLPTFGHQTLCTSPSDGADSSKLFHVFLNSKGETIDIATYEENDKFGCQYFLNENGEAVIVDATSCGDLRPGESLTKEEWPVPTEIDGVPVAEILPGAYATLGMKVEAGGYVLLYYYDVFAYSEPILLASSAIYGGGDVTDNGEFSVSDAVYGARLIAEDKTLQVSDAGREAADMDASGKVDAKDLTLMLDILATDRKSVV